MNSKGFRVVLDFSEFFSDERRKSYVYINNVPEKTVFDLQCRIRKLFCIKNGISLLADGCFLHPQETVFVLHEEDIVKVIRSGFTNTINVAEKDEERNTLEDSTLKRKRERVKEPEKAEECNPKPRKSKKKRCERSEAFQKIVGNENTADNAEGNSQLLINQIDLQIENESEITANDSIEGYKRKIKRKLNKKVSLKEQADTENAREEKECEEYSPKINVSGFSQASPMASSSQYVDSGVAVCGEEEVESKTTKRESLDFAQFENVNVKKKRRRRHKKKKEDTATVNDYPSVKTNAPEVHGMVGCGKHIKFDDDGEEEEEVEQKNDDRIFDHNQSSTVKNSVNLEPTSGNESLQTDITADIFKRINAFLQTRRECNSEISMHMPPPLELPKHANNLESPSTQWDVQCTGSSQLFNGIFNSEKISTPLVFECKKPTTKAENSSKPTQSKPDPLVERDRLNYSEYPLLQGSPKEDDMLAFKVWKLGEDYSPGISDFIVGKVLIFSEPEKYIKLKIIRGHAELKEPNGKFSIHRRPEGDEGDEELTILEEEPLIDELETELGKIFEVRLLFP